MTRKKEEMVNEMDCFPNLEGRKAVSQSVSQSDIWQRSGFRVVRRQFPLKIETCPNKQTPPFPPSVSELNRQLTVTSSSTLSLPKTHSIFTFTLYNTQITFIPSKFQTSFKTLNKVNSH